MLCSLAGELDAPRSSHSVERQPKPGVNVSPISSKELLPCQRKCPRRHQRRPREFSQSEPLIPASFKPKCLRFCQTKFGRQSISTWTARSTSEHAPMKTKANLTLIALALFWSLPLAAQNPASEPVTLFQNVRIFDGKSGTLSAPSHLLVRGNKIERVSSDTIQSPADANVTVIDGGGRTLMPGLIDVHWHAMLIRATPAQAIAGDVGYNNIAAGAEATDTLLRGFTTVRDVGGPSFGLKQAIDEGIVAGPRIFPSGAVITITGGHGDFRQLSELPRTIGGPLSRME